MIRPPPISPLFPPTTLFRSKMALRIPAVTLYNGLFFGKEIHMGLEMMAVGVPAALLGPDVKLPFADPGPEGEDRKSTRLNSSHQIISYALFCFKKKKTTDQH